MTPCVVDGFELLPPTRVVVCQTVSDYAANLFKDPLKFDIDRYLPDRAEPLAPADYAPYGLGTHHCLGNRWSSFRWPSRFR